MRPGLRDWKPCVPLDAVEWLDAVDAPWWIAGGWALDLFLGRRTREHADLDVGCFREDLEEIRAALRGWRLYAAHQGRLTELPPLAIPGAEVHSLWCRPEGARAWWLELMLDDREGGDWVYRRAPAIRRPVEELILRDVRGTPHLRPEVQLLYKAKGRRLRDEGDLQVTLPRLDDAARAWLRDALHTWEPGHPWIGEIPRG